MYAAAITAGTSIINAVNSLLHGDSKDPQRFAANSTAYQLASNGDANAAQFLYYRSGKFGITSIPGYGQVGGWATETAKADAWAKWQQLQVHTTAQGIGSQIGNALQPVIQPAANQAAAHATRTILIVGGVALLAFYWFTHRKD